MKFEEVLPALREGKKIKRNFWREDTYFYKNHQGTIIFKNGGEDTYYYNLTLLLDSNDWEIVKEKKKVKLRDLTKEQYKEYEKHCEEGCAERICDKCPFREVNCDLNNDTCWFYHKDLYSDKFLNQEIEIEEE